MAIIIPSVIIYFIEIEYESFKKDFLIRLSLIITALSPGQSPPPVKTPIRISCETPALN